MSLTDVQQNLVIDVLSALSDPFATHAGSVLLRHNNNNNNNNEGKWNQ